MLKIDVLGTRITLDPACSALHWLIGRHKPGRFHEDGTAGHFLDMSKGCDTIWDLGCHVGWYAALFASDRPDAKVFLLDPDASAITWAGAHVAMNQPGAKVFQLSVEISAAPGSETWTQSAIESLGQPGLVKVDIEGSEFVALGQMRNLISALRPGLFIELHAHLGLPDYLEELWASIGWLESIYERVRLADKDTGECHPLCAAERRLAWPNGILIADRGERWG